MKKLLTFIFLAFSISVFGQTPTLVRIERPLFPLEKLIDSLKFVKDMPYICEKTGSAGCGDSTFWQVVKQNYSIIPLLINSLDDTTETTATVPNFGEQYTVGDICFIALQEIIHCIPTFKIAGVKFDKRGCGYCSFWNYIRQPKNRIEFKSKVSKWYYDKKPYLAWIKSEKYEICDCSGIHPNGGHYEVQKRTVNFVTVGM